MNKKKKLVPILVSVLVVLGLVLVGLNFLTGGILGEMLFDRPSKPVVKNAEFPFELVYEYNGQQYTVKESIICEYEGIEFTLDGGNHREWNCYVTNNEDYGRYLLDPEKSLTFFVQVPLEAEYYMGAPNFNEELAMPYIHYIDDATGTMYYEQDLMDEVGARIVRWTVAAPLTDNIK